MKYFIVIFLVGVVSGCGSMPKHEMTWQAVHVVDALQTLNGPSMSDCYRETNTFTTRLIGEKPSRGKVAAWAVTGSLVHWGVSSLLEDKAPPWALTAWQSVTIGSAALTVYDNHQLGIRPWGDNHHSGGCDDGF